MGTLQDRIAKAEDKLKQIKAEQQKVEARKKAAEETRRLCSRNWRTEPGNRVHSDDGCGVNAGGSAVVWVGGA